MDVSIGVRAALSDSGPRCVVRPHAEEAWLAFHPPVFRPCSASTRVRNRFGVILKKFARRGNFGVAGFSAWPMYYRGAADAHFSRPVSDRRPPATLGRGGCRLHAWKRPTSGWPRRARALGTASHHVHVQSRGIASGGVLSAGSGSPGFDSPGGPRVLFPRGPPCGSGSGPGISSSLRPLPACGLEGTAPDPDPRKTRSGLLRRRNGQHRRTHASATSA